MAAGEYIVVWDMQSVEYECCLEEFLPDKVIARIESQRKYDTEPPYTAFLYQALPKGDKLDSVIQKSVESGVYEIVTFMSERCIAKEKVTEEKKLERRNRIAFEAAKQSRRGIIPEVRPTVTFDEMLSEASRCDICIFCYEGEGTSSLKEVLQEKRAELCTLDRKPTISLVIGSEGGFSLSEVERAQAAGLIPVGLGKRILRTETAPGFALGCIVYEFEL